MTTLLTAHAGQTKSKKSAAELQELRALTDSNAPLLVSISDRCRQLIESTLQSLRGGSILRPLQLHGAADTQQLGSKGRRCVKPRHFCQRVTVCMCPSLRVALLQRRADAKAHLEHMGFAAAHVQAALDFVGPPYTETAALDWLCLTLRDDDIPKVLV